jgi:TRAP-type mannitol/chloroaromatic compound transport system permease small subunit
MSHMRHALDTLYKISLWLSALCLAIIASMVGAQLAGRLLDGTLALLHLPRTDFVILSLAEIAGYLLAAASFLALAPTLKAGAHIRVTMALGAVGPRLRYFIEIVAFAIGAIGAVYVTWNLAKFAYVSWQFGDVSPGVVRVPLWIPQAAMAIGAAVFSIALIDELIMVLRGHGPSFRASEDSISLGKEG